MQISIVSTILVVILGIFSCSANAETKPNYSETVEAIAKRRGVLAKEWQAKPSARLQNAIESEIISSVEELFGYWLGTTWALGAPQTKTPQSGKINCGTFVGRVLHDSGFVVKVKKLQRQPSQLIIKSFVGRGRIRKFSNAKMDKFLASVREMGPGLFIIGLDFHVGFLLQTETDLRFIHASYETETVVNEDATTAMPITTSGYKVVGKILSPQNIRSWLSGGRINVKGKW